MLPSPDFTIGPMTRIEVDTLGDWAAAEGWNPGLSDLQIAWDIDPDAFVAMRLEDGVLLADSFQGLSFHIDLATGAVRASAFLK